MDNVEFYPERGSKRLVSFINTRNEWCISRQRSWGVPIPVMYHKKTGKALLDDKVIEQIIKVIEEEDMDSWFKNDDMTKWLSPEYRHKANDYIRGTDTMDVWFDSGSSWKVIESYLKEEGILDQAEKRGYLSNVYLEGSDRSSHNKTKSLFLFKQSFLVIKLCIHITFFILPMIYLTECPSFKAFSHFFL